MCLCICVCVCVLVCVRVCSLTASCSSTYNDFSIFHSHILFLTCESHTHKSSFSSSPHPSLSIVLSTSCAVTPSLSSLPHKIHVCVCTVCVYCVCVLCVYCVCVFCVCVLCVCTVCVYCVCVLCVFCMCVFCMYSVYRILKCHRRLHCVRSF